MKNFILETLITLLIAVAVFFGLQLTIMSSIVVGSSMEPNFQDGQRLIVNKAVFHFREPVRGEVIILHPTSDFGKDYIKRVIGLPGDVIEVKQGTVYINGKPLKEPYIKDSPRYTLLPQIIPENSYFVLGDNRNNSNDSHSGLGTVPRQNLIGKAWLSIWPPADWGVIGNYQLQEQISAE